MAGGDKDKERNIDDLFNVLYPFIKQYGKMVKLSIYNKRNFFKTWESRYLPVSKGIHIFIRKELSGNSNIPSI